MLIGFVGVLVLFWLKLASGMNAGLLGAMAMLFGASCFAIGLLMIKRFAKDHPVVVARNILISSAAQLLLAAPFVADLSAFTLPSQRAMGAVAMLGIFCTGLVCFLYMALIQRRARPSPPSATTWCRCSASCWVPCSSASRSSPPRRGAGADPGLGRPEPVGPAAPQPGSGRPCQAS